MRLRLIIWSLGLMTVGCITSMTQGASPPDGLTKKTPPQTTGPVRLESSPTRQVLLELFTSEGCSSCPPAERWFNQLTNQKELWKSYVPVVFHVDYWNDLGWTDPLSNGAFSNRQRLLARQWRSPQVYTPGVMAGGAEFRSWRGGKLPSSNAKVGVLKVASTSSNSFQLSFQPNQAGQFKGRRLNFHSARLLFGYSSQVQSGENRGETLVHDFSVCHHQVTTAKVGQGGGLSAKLNLGKCQLQGKSQGIAVWVSDRDTLEPIQAVGGYLPQ